MRIVVTGGLGFIGSNFIRKIAQTRGCEIINIDKMTYAANPFTAVNLLNLKNYEYYQEDICNQSAIESILRKGDILVNFAAESHVDRSINNSTAFLQTNVIGIDKLLCAARNKDVDLFLQVSTDEIYGSLEKNQLSSVEEDNFRPSSPYSASKAASEMLCFSAMKTFSQRIIITRSSNNYGPYQCTEKMIPLFITKLINNKKLPLYGNGLNIRDWIYVEDNCEAIDFLIDNGKTGEVYNIGGGNEMTNLALVKIMLNLFKKDESNIEYVKDRPGHDLRYSLNCNKLKQLGWKPRMPFEQGISETIDWYRKNDLWCSRFV